MSKRKILLLVEGEKADIAVMCRLLTVYNLNIDYEIIPYWTNIYRLYKDFFDSGDDPENLDLYYSNLDDLRFIYLHRNVKLPAFFGEQFFIFT